MTKAILVLGTIIFCAGCATSQVTAGVDDSTESKFEQVNLGDSAEQVVRIFGKTEIGGEQYGKTAYQVLAYSNSNDLPEVFFTVEPSTQKIVGKSLWVSARSKLRSVSYAKSHLMGQKWLTLNPCHSTGEPGKILIDEEAGLYLATAGDSVVLASWVTPELARQRIHLIMKGCPQLQK